MHEYKAENPDELTLEVGQVVDILKQVCYAMFTAVLLDSVHYFHDLPFASITK